MLKWNCSLALRSYRHIFHIYQGLLTRQLKKKTKLKKKKATKKPLNEYSWQSINIHPRWVMWRKNIHSSLTFSSRTQRARLSVQVCVRPAGPPAEASGLSVGKAQPRFVRAAPSGRRGLLVWSLPSLCWSKTIKNLNKNRVKCTLLEPQTPLSESSTPIHKFQISGPVAQTQRRSVLLVSVLGAFPMPVQCLCHS